MDGIQKQLESPAKVYLVRFKNKWLFDSSQNALVGVEDFEDLPKHHTTVCYDFDDAWQKAKELGATALKVKMIDGSTQIYDFS